jgi:hypothetical protein
MKNLTPKQLEKLENQIGTLSFKLYKICQQVKVSDKNDELMDERFDDYDSQTQEAMIVKLNHVDFFLDELHCLIQSIRENEGA